jgi:GT2 family glycosyltransferase
MNITFVMAVFNNLDLTKNCYKRLRDLYPETPLVISSGGSTDGTKEWLEEISDIDEYITIFHDDERLTFSETYNTGIKLVDTEKLVLIHNDLVIGEGFLESIDKHLKPNMLLSYTTIEPPIFEGHERPGKVINDMGTNFDNFKWDMFNQYVTENKHNCEIYDGSVFFMSGYKELFENVGYFDGFSFVPAFAEDDDFIIRTKLKGYELKTINCAITYHFVSQTSRFSDEFKENKLKYEINSNRNFIRKWGIPISSFNQIRYWEENDFKYPIFTMGLTTTNHSKLPQIEPFFDKINLGTIPYDYLLIEQENTKYDLRSKFVLTDIVDVMVYEINPMTDEDIYVLQKLRLSIPLYGVGVYIIGNMKIDIRKEINPFLSI